MPCFCIQNYLTSSFAVYSNATDQVNSLVYDGFVEEIVNTLELPDERDKLSVCMAFYSHVHMQGCWDYSMEREPK